MPALREQMRKLREQLKDVGSPAYCQCGEWVIVAEGDPVPEVCPRCGKAGARIIVEVVIEREQGQEA